MNIDTTIRHYEEHEDKSARTNGRGASYILSDATRRDDVRTGKRANKAVSGRHQQRSRENSATIRTTTDENKVPPSKSGNMKTCYIYLRVSTDEQATEGFSLENQKRACMDYAHNHGYHARRIFLDDGKSGRTTQRPAFQELIAEIEKYKVDALIIYKIDRFARNVSDFRDTRKEIEAKGVEMISVLEGNVTKGSSLIANILASVAEWESDVNGQRTRDALMQKFREGWQPTPPPVGYRSVGGDRERKTCEPDPHTAPIIKELFELYATGNYSIVEIQDWLADRNIISRNGTGLGHSVIHTILNNPFYYGIIRWHGESKIGNHVPIISKEMYDVCQYVLAKHRNFLMRRRIHKWLLGGFAYCAECGQRYVAEWHKNEHKLRARGGKIAYYHCPKRERNGCRAPYIEMEDLEYQVEQEFKNMQFAPEFIEAVVRKNARKARREPRKRLKHQTGYS
ncbi:MAG: Transposon Tn3 resolvase [Microgenomates bacterium OLB22]|nr:MAG: Transposon Tn3 resolvase [Microgenomates bacterium OLB22]